MGWELSSDPAHVRPGRRTIMVVEDEYLVAMEIEIALREAQFEVAGPHRTVSEALCALEASLPDAAILDWNLGGETSEKIAAILKQRNVPFLISTGYGYNFFADTPVSDVPIVLKPLDTRILLDRLKSLLPEASNT